MNFKKIPPSTTVLLFSNLISIYFALTQHWTLGEVAWVYFFQNIIIGVFHFFKVLLLKTFNTDGLRIDDQYVPPNSRKARNFLAMFFLAHYSIFHLFFGLLLLDDQATLSTFLKDPYFLLTLISFIFNHFFSFISNYKNDNKKNLNIGILAFFPYIRVLPMLIGCVMIVSKVINEQFLLYFMLIKCVADLATHAGEHALVRDGENGMVPKN